MTGAGQDGSRGALMAEVTRLLGNRRLVWAGIRSDDIEPLADLPQLTAAFGFAGSYDRRAAVTSLAYEQLTGVRVDPEIWDIDDHLRDDAATVEFRHGLLARLAARQRPAALPPVALPLRRPLRAPGPVPEPRPVRRPSVRLRAQAVGRDRCRASSACRASRGPTSPTRSSCEARELGRHGPLVLRRSRTSGGEGFVRVERPERAGRALAPRRRGVRQRRAVPRRRPAGQRRRHGLARTATRHGAPPVGAADRHRVAASPGEFGYCGNDFGLARDSTTDHRPDRDVDRRRSAAGCAATDTSAPSASTSSSRTELPLFTEINPRFQGSTRASCRLSIEPDEACLMLEHLAAWLGVPMPEPRPTAGAGRRGTGPRQRRRPLDRRRDDECQRAVPRRGGARGRQASLGGRARAARRDQRTRFGGGEVPDSPYGDHDRIRPHYRPRPRGAAWRRQ